MRRCRRRGLSSSAAAGGRSDRTTAKLKSSLRCLRAAANVFLLLIGKLLFLELLFIISKLNIPALMWRKRGVAFDVSSEAARCERAKKLCMFKSRFSDGLRP